MKSLLLLLLALVAAITASATALPSPHASVFSAKELQQGYRDHVILAKPRAAHRGTVDADESREGVHVHAKFPRFDDLRVITLDDTDTPEAAIARLQASGRYEFVERDYLRSIQATTPYDPEFLDGSLWALSNTGQVGSGSVSGVPGADISALPAWNIIHDAPNVVVAVVDTGIALTHQDIAPNLWTNPAPTNNDVHGANFVGGDGKMENGNPNDDEGHGTHVAGTIGAVGNNGIASVGVAWKVQLMAVKVLDSTGVGSTSAIIAGINYAIAHGATIINASFGDNATTAATSYSQQELDAITAAKAAGIIFVAAAGNEGANLDLARSYPASFPIDNVVTVGSSNRQDEVSSFSNYGAAIDLFAPGEEIVSLDSTTSSGTKLDSGTSMAAPHVSGALALLKAQFPQDTYRQSINRLLRGVDRRDSFIGRAQSGGRLNLYNALHTQGDSANRPFNDDFADRPHFSTDNLSIRADNAGASAESADPSIGGFAPNATLWWEWTAPLDGTITITTVGSSYDPLLAVYTGTSLGSLARVSTNVTDAGTSTGHLTFAAQAGTIYQIEVDGNNGASGLTLVNLATTPANDAFASPATITGESTAIVAVNRNASRELGEPTILGFAGGNSLWYQWTAPRTARFQVSALSTDFDPILAVYTGTTLANLSRTLVSASDNTGSDNTQTAALCTIDAKAGTTYRITVDTKTASTVGQFTLTLVDSLWQATTAAELTASPAVAPDGTVYIGGLDRVFHAFNPDGSEKWRVTTGGSIDACSPALGDDGTVYFGSFDGSVYAVGSDGKQKWKHLIGAGFDASYSPAIATNGTIYLRASDGFLHALSAADGSELWKKSVATTATNFYGSPVVGSDGTVYQGSDENDKTLYAFNADGSAKWTVALDSGVYGAPAIDDSGNLYLVTLTGSAYAISSSGNQLWHATSGGSVSSSVALSADGSTLYYGAYDGYLYARETATGAVKWKYHLGTEVRASSPALDANGTVYIGCYDHKVYAIHADGSLNRVYDTGNIIRSAPAISGTRLYVGSSDQKLYAFDLPAGPSTGSWAQYRANARRLGRIATDTPLQITTQPQAQTTIAGGSFALNVVAVGQGPFAYQWMKNGTAISGATSATYALTGADIGSAGSYTVVVSTPQGTVTSSPAIVTVQTTNPGRLVNLSVRTTAGTGDSTLTVGMSIAGSANKPLLVRGIGPSLTQFSIPDALTAPQLTVLTFDEPKVLVAANSGWTDSASLRNTFDAVGAFGLATNSGDDALTTSVHAGTYTVQVTGANNATGTALAEVYDLDPLGTSTGYSRLVNLSARAQVGTGANVLIAGFSISGNVSKQLLIRGIGPALAAYGVSGTLANPQIEIYDTAKTRWGSNDDWGGGAALQVAFAQVQAFALPDPNSKDAALVITLPPGTYSAVLSGVGSTTGVGLIELYEMP